MVTGALSIVYELSARCCFIASAFVGYCDDMFRPGGVMSSMRRLRNRCATSTVDLYYYCSISRRASRVADEGEKRVIWGTPPPLAPLRYFLGSS